MKQLIFISILFLSIQQSFAQAIAINDFDTVIFGMFHKETPVNTFNYNGQYMPERRPTAIEKNAVSASHKYGESNEKQLTLGVNASQIAWDKVSPHSLTSLELSGQYLKFNSDNSILGVMVNAGSSSDEVFSGTDVLSYGTFAYYSRPSSETTSWVYSIFLSNNNPFISNFPIPGIMWKKQTEKLTTMIGLPYTGLKYKFTPDFDMAAFYFWSNGSLKLTYSAHQFFRIISAFVVSQQTFMGEDRSTDLKRLFFNEKKVFVGFNADVSKVWNVEYQIGQSFDRRLREGKDYTQYDLVYDFDRSWYTSINLSAWF